MGYRVFIAVVCSAVLAFSAGCGDDDGGGGTDKLLDAGNDTSVVEDGGDLDTGDQDTGEQDTGGQADAVGQDTGGQDTGGQDTGGQDTSSADSGTDGSTGDAGYEDADMDAGDTEMADSGGGDTGTADSGGGDTGMVDSGSGDTGMVDSGGDATTDPCDGVTCDSPPDDYCTGDTLTDYDATGTCQVNGGVAECIYGVAGIDCTTQDQVCQDGACVEPEVCNNRDDDDQDGDIDCADSDCSSDPACAFGYNLDFEDWTVSNPPVRYEVPKSTDLQVDEETGSVLEGSSSSSVLVNGDFDRTLRYGLRVPATGKVIVHAWFYGIADTQVRAGFWDANASSADMAPTATQGDGTWQEVTHTITTSSTPVLYPQVSFEAVGGTSHLSITDAWAVTQRYDFTADDGTLDSAAVEVASSGGSASVDAAINNAGDLYAAHPAPRTTNDQFLYVWVGGPDTSGSNVDAPWDKAGSVAAPSSGGELFVLAVEESNNYCDWRVWDQANKQWKKVSESCHVGNVAEGTVDLGNYFGSAVDVPRTVSVASVSYYSNSVSDGGGDLVSIIPAEVTDDDIVEAGETAQIERFDMLAGEL